MNEKPHTHTLLFYPCWNQYDKRAAGYPLRDPDPDIAEAIKYGDQQRRWPQLKDFSRKVRKHWWSLRKRVETVPLEEQQHLLRKAREACVQEIVATHDAESIFAGDRDAERQARVDRYTRVVKETALKPWQKQLNK